MIPSQELRIGNYVFADEKLQQISMISQQSAITVMTAIDNTKTSIEYTLESIRPVMLTDEILVQCGFLYHDYFKFWQLIVSSEGIRSEMDIDRDYNIIDFMRKPVVHQLTSLHQLQNIYFMLKGRELSYDVKKKTPAVAMA